MITDRSRVEDGIIPMLLRGIALSHIDADPSVEGSYKNMLITLEDYVAECFKGLTAEKRLSLYRRLDRIVHKLSKYFVEQDFTTRKAFLTVSEWVRALLEAGALTINPKSRYFALLNEIGEMINKGYGEIEDFDKIDASAINHVPKLHSITQKEGYFL